MSNVTRYSIGVTITEDLSIDAEPDGEWVKYDDIKHLLKPAHERGSSLIGDAPLSGANTRLIQRVLHPTGRLTGEMTLDDLGRLLDAARREEGRPAHEREPPHCSTCECGMLASGAEQLSRPAEPLAILGQRYADALRSLIMPGGDMALISPFVAWATDVLETDKPLDQCGNQ